MKKKYVLCPEKDIGRGRLTDCYGVRLDECIIWDDRYPEERRGYSYDFLNGLVWLYVLPKGNYKERLEELERSRGLKAIAQVSD